MLRHALRPLLALAFALAPALGDAALYRWVDELGVTHYATNLDAIPSSERGDAMEIVVSPAPAAATRVMPVPPAPPESAPEPPTASAPVSAPVSAPTTLPVESAPPAPSALEAPPLLPATREPTTTPPTPPMPEPAPQPLAKEVVPTPTAPSVLPGPPTTPAISAGDPRAAEVADLEAKIAADRERLREMISTKRWDSAELASDPSIREIADRLPRLQAELAALRAEIVP